MESTTQCPYCKETIIAGAQKCRYCGEWLVSQKRWITLGELPLFLIINWRKIKASRWLFMTILGTVKAPIGAFIVQAGYRFVGIEPATQLSGKLGARPMPAATETVTTGIFPGMNPNYTILAIISMAIVMSFIQWLMLRRYIKHAYLWIIVNSIALPLVYVNFAHTYISGTNISFVLVVAIVINFIVGLILLYRSQSMLSKP